MNDDSNINFDFDQFISNLDVGGKFEKIEKNKFRLFLPVNDYDQKKIKLYLLNKNGTIFISDNGYTIRKLRNSINLQDESSLSYIKYIFQRHDLVVSKEAEILYTRSSSIELSNKISDFVKSIVICLSYAN